MTTDFGIHIENEDCLQQITLDINTKRLELYDWQNRGIKYFFSHNNKAIFQVATGAGKTIFAIEILKRIHNINPDLRCLVVCPKNVIVETGWYQELYRAGYNIPDIGIFYGMGREYAKVTITNMQSLRNVALEIFDIIILDECFDGNTIIKTNKGNIKIKDIVNKKIKCDVLSFNIKNKKNEWKKIEQYYKINEKREVLKITLENGKKLIITPEQLIYNGKKYISANKLKINDNILFLSE